MKHRHLKRLEREEYRGIGGAVHWTFTIAKRSQGWLTAEFHVRFREILAHMAVRYHCAVPIYCLMPDHMHLLLWGPGADADLYLSAQFLRKHSGRHLLPAKYQKQAYDHVLTEKELGQNAFETICAYIAENPLRAGLVEKAANYPFSGAVVLGYPDLDIHADQYWDLFWKVSCSRAREGVEG